MRDAPTTRRRRVRPRSWSTSAPIAFLSISTLSTSVWLCACDGAAIPGHATIQNERRLDDLADVNTTAILAQIGRVNCSESVTQTIYRFLDANQRVTSGCKNDSGFTPLRTTTSFPYGTRLPTSDETAKIIASPTCMDLMTGVVLVKLPECEYQYYSPRSFAESFLRIRVDLVDHGRRPPSETEFGQLYALNRVINYLTENPAIQARVKTTFNAADAATRLNPATVNPDVILLDGIAVTINKTVVVGTNAGSGDDAEKANATATTTVVPTTTPLANDTNVTMTTTVANDRDLPENLQLAYAIVGNIWLVLNVVYFWFITRKDALEKV